MVEIELFFYHRAGAVLKLSLKTLLPRSKADGLYFEQSQREKMKRKCNLKGKWVKTK